MVHVNRVNLPRKQSKVVCFLLGNYLESGFYMPTFRNTLFHLHRQVDVSRMYSTHIYLSMKMEQTEFSETLAYKIQTPGNYLKESIQHTEHGESLKSSPKLARLFFLDCL